MNAPTKLSGSPRGADHHNRANASANVRKTLDTTTERLRFADCDAAGSERDAVHQMAHRSEQENLGGEPVLDDGIEPQSVTPTRMRLARTDSSSARKS